MRAPLLAHLENQELITLSACLRPHQACTLWSIGFPFTFLVPLNPQKSELYNPVPIPTLTPERMLLGIDDMDSNELLWLVQTLPNTLDHLSPNTNPTTLTNFQKKKKRGNRTLRVPAGFPVKGKKR